MPFPDDKSNMAQIYPRTFKNAFSYNISNFTKKKKKKKKKKFKLDNVITFHIVVLKVAISENCF